MKAPYLLLIITLVGIYSFNFKSTPPPESGNICITPAEAKLSDLINEYRRSKNLPGIPLSVSLTKVARMHAEDLSKNYSAGKNCNLHSWSKDPRWSSCCYTPDHKRAACMWDKPRELTNYKGDGYEIAYFSNFNYSSETEFVMDAMQGWKSSKGHNDLLINGGKWKSSEWKAMGVAVQGDYAVVWLGELTDQDGKPTLCFN